MAVHKFEDLPSLMDRYAAQTGKLVTLAAQRAALAGGDYLARETPVDTGVARSNWVMRVDESFEGIIPAYVPYPTYRPNHHASVKLFSLHSKFARPRVRVRRLSRFSPRGFGV